MNEDTTKRVAMIATGVALAGVAATVVKSARDKVASATSTAGVTVARGTGETYEAWLATATQSFEAYGDVTLNVLECRASEFVRWEATPGDSATRFDGTTHFREAPGDRGTEVALSMNGPVPRPVVFAILRRFKSLLETGEIPTLAANPSGRA